MGTPATRAAIIETLLKRNYIKRQKKSNFFHFLKFRTVYGLAKAGL
ncbi:hypothetical protein PG291_07230 [Riemerella anatipestifer]|nr:hypothetical protein [Riemerella anatipestifer]